MMTRNQRQILKYFLGGVPDNGYVYLSFSCSWMLFLLSLGRLTLLHGCFSRFLKYTNGTKSRKASHIRKFTSLLQNT